MHRKKNDINTIRPDKLCPVCLRTFSWRKKWEKDWPEVKYCSEKCRRNKNPGKERSLLSPGN